MFVSTQNPHLLETCPTSLRFVVNVFVKSSSLRLTCRITKPTAAFEVNAIITSPREYAKLMVRFASGCNPWNLHLLDLLEWIEDENLVYVRVSNYAVDRHTFLFKNCKLTGGDPLRWFGFLLQPVRFLCIRRHL